MLKKLLSGLTRSPSSTISRARFHPYSEPGANEIYHYLFCDDREAFRPARDAVPAAWQGALFDSPPDEAKLRQIAGDESQEGRARYLCYGRLRELSREVPAKILLGVIVEMPLPNGLDVLACYSDSGVRYINHTGKMSIIETPVFEAYVRNVFAAAARVVSQIGPANEARRPPPVLGAVRLSFLVSDGPYFGEGGINVMQQDPLAGPIIQEASALLAQVVELSVSGEPAS